MGQTVADLKAAKAQLEEGLARIQSVIRAFQQQEVESQRLLDTALKKLREAELGHDVSDVDELDLDEENESSQEACPDSAFKQELDLQQGREEEQRLQDEEQLQGEVRRQSEDQQQDERQDEEQQEQEEKHGFPIDQEQEEILPEQKSPKLEQNQERNEQEEHEQEQEHEVPGEKTHCSSILFPAQPRPKRRKVALSSTLSRCETPSLLVPPLPNEDAQDEMRDGVGRDESSNDNSNNMSMQDDEDAPMQDDEVSEEEHPSSQEVKEAEKAETDAPSNLKRRMSKRSNRHRFKFEIQSPVESKHTTAKKPSVLRKKKKGEMLVSSKKIVRRNVVVTEASGFDNNNFAPPLREQRALFLLAAKVLAQQGSVVDEEKAFTAGDPGDASTYADVLTALMKEKDLPACYRERVEKALNEDRLVIRKTCIIEELRNAIKGKSKSKSKSKSKRKKAVAMIKFAIDGRLHTMKECRINLSRFKRAGFRLLRHATPVAQVKTKPLSRRKAPSLRKLHKESAEEVARSVPADESVRDFDGCSSDDSI
ncbi:MAG: hypothetical protein MHM6MM_001137 [Cercozoa sp. M6MM]